MKGIRLGLLERERGIFVNQEVKKAMKKGWQFELQEGEGRILDRVRTYQNVKGAL